MRFGGRCFSLEDVAAGLPIIDRLSLEGRGAEHVLHSRHGCRPGGQGRLAYAWA